jgi:translation initiation factor 4E
LTTTTAGLASPTTGGATAFGLGSGAFASFGSVAKTPKTPGTVFDFKSAATSTTQPTTPVEKRERAHSRVINSARKESISASIPEDAMSPSGQLDARGSLPIKYTWVIWFRPPTPKNNDWEKSIQAVWKLSLANDLWKVYRKMMRPSKLQPVSDYHVFKEGIRPVWEDEENKRGGKWIMRVKKGVADHYWEWLLMAIVGNEFGDAGDEVCGLVVSVRSGEDVFSIWTKNDGGRNVKIRETVKRVLSLPADTNITWRSHDESIAQRTALDQARHERRKVAPTGDDKP